MAKSAARIGILGGSFNPIHNGHIFMAQAAIKALGLDQVVFVPAHCSPHKQSRLDLASAQDRLAMVRLAIRGHTKFSVSDVEIKRGGVSYTVDTLKYFRRRYPKADLFFIIGEDSSKRLSEWKDFDTISSLASFIAVNRSQCPVSSSQIRQKIAGRQSIKGLTPRVVADYIQKKGLYVERD